MKLCRKCDNSFVPTVSYQIYCGEACRNEATKEKIENRYNVTRRQKRIGKERKCLGECGQQLSIYNDSKFCPNCNVSEKQVIKMIKQLKGFVEYEQE